RDWGTGGTHDAGLKRCPPGGRDRHLSGPDRIDLEWRRRWRRRLSNCQLDAVTPLPERCPPVVAGGYGSTPQVHCHGSLTHRGRATLDHARRNDLRLGGVEDNPVETGSTICQRAARLQIPSGDGKRLIAARLDRHGPGSDVGAVCQRSRVKGRVINVPAAVTGPDDRLDLMIADLCGQVAVSLPGREVRGAAGRGQRRTPGRHAAVLLVEPQYVGDLVREDL